MPTSRRTWILFLLSILYFLAILYFLHYARHKKSIDTLGEECQAGNKESCIGLVRHSFIGDSLEQEKTRTRIGMISNREVLTAVTRDLCLSHDQAASYDELCQPWLSNAKFVDEAVLIEVATTAKDKNLAEVAAEKITDQAGIRLVALGAPHESVRLTAAKNLTQKDDLAKLAFEDPAEAVRKAAFLKLARLAHPEESMSFVGETYDFRMFEFDRFREIDRLLDLDPRLMRIAGDLEVESVVNYDPSNNLARMKLATQDPLIQARLPGLKCTGRINRESQGYHYRYGGLEPTLLGEAVTLTFKRNATALAEMTWKTEFADENPAEIDPKEAYGFKHAMIRGQDLLATVFRSPAFSQDDLKKLTSSNIAVVRIGAMLTISDPAFLAQIAPKDKSAWVRREAVQMITDRTVLGEMATKDPDLQVREDASNRLSRLKFEWDELHR